MIRKTLCTTGYIIMATAYLYVLALLISFANWVANPIIAMLVNGSVCMYLAIAIYVGYWAYTKLKK